MSKMYVSRHICTELGVENESGVIYVVLQIEFATGYTYIPVENLPPESKDRLTMPLVGDHMQEGSGVGSEQVTLCTPTSVATLESVINVGKVNGEFTACMNMLAT